MRLANGVPIGKLPIVDIRNAHASYVATWYAFTFAFKKLCTHFMQVFALSAYYCHVHAVVG
jgi:cytochrome oxidase assembly protein ShyY1